MKLKNILLLALAILILCVLFKIVFYIVATCLIATFIYCLVDNSIKDLEDL